MSSPKQFSFVKRERLFLNLIFTTNLLHKKLVLFDILVEWLMKPKQETEIRLSLQNKDKCK